MDSNGGKVWVFLECWLFLFFVCLDDIIGKVVVEARMRGTEGFGDEVRVSERESDEGLEWVWVDF